MFRPFVAKLKPASGFSHFLHLGLMVLLPIVVFILVRAGFLPLAIVIILLSKWRMFAVRPRFWPAIVRANSVDILVGLSIALFMTRVGVWWQLFWVATYIAWLIYVKPASSIFMTSIQAAVGQLFALSAVYLTWTAAPLIGLVFATGVVCYMAARHFFDGFEEP
ncbi:MAG TPA: hypothetical protein VF261_00220, partial [Candidatus Saccharimonadales bacterium]